MPQLRIERQGSRYCFPRYGGRLNEDIVVKRRGRKPGSKNAVRKGTLPALYQDSKTGKTWSGRGRAPAWLGKNRERFRIAA